MPIVKFEAKAPGYSYQCDVGINNLLALENSALIRAYMGCDLRARQLTYIIKHWAKQRKINDPFRGTLSSYAYVLMTVHYLQQLSPPVLPCLQSYHSANRPVKLVSGYDCFPESETRVLTDTGFLFLDDIEARLAAGDSVLYACYEPEPGELASNEDALRGRLVYRTGVLVLPYEVDANGRPPDRSPPTELLTFCSAGEAQRWTADSGPYGTAKEEKKKDDDEEDAEEKQTDPRSLHASLTVTPTHRMYVQKGRWSESAQHAWYDQHRGVDIAPDKVLASDLSMEEEAAVRLLACAASGHVPTSTASVNALRLRLRLSSERRFAAFLEVFGFWLGNGTLLYPSSGASGAVRFAQVKAEGIKFLDETLPKTGLSAHEIQRSVTHLKRADGSKKDVVTWDVINVRWFEFFDDEFGVKYSRSRHYDRRLARVKQGLHTVRAGRAGDAAETQASHADSSPSSTRTRRLSATALTPLSVTRSRRASTSLSVPVSLGRRFSAASADDYPVEDQGDAVCHVCLSDLAQDEDDDDDQANPMLVCDGLVRSQPLTSDEPVISRCLRGLHLRCSMVTARPVTAVPAGKWYCDECDLVPVVVFHTDPFEEDEKKADEQSSQMEEKVDEKEELLSPQFSVGDYEEVAALSPQMEDDKAIAAMLAGDEAEAAAAALSTQVEGDGAVAAMQQTEEWEYDEPVYASLPDSSDEGSQASSDEEGDRPMKDEELHTSEDEDVPMEEEEQPLTDEQPPVGAPSNPEDDSPPPLETLTQPPPADVPSEPEEDEPSEPDEDEPDEPTEEDDPPEEAEPPTDDPDYPIKSVKWLPPWVLLCLTQDQSLTVLQGLWRADGAWKHRGKRIYTSGARFRDQLVQLLLHCGCSAVPRMLYTTGTVRAYMWHNQKVDKTVYTIKTWKTLSAAQQKLYRAIKAGSDCWSVEWADTSSAAGKDSCWISLHNREAITAVPYSRAQHGRIWYDPCRPHPLTPRTRLPRYSVSLHSPMLPRCVLALPCAGA